MTLEHLDTLISFVIVIAGVSLMITTLTQLVSAVLGLRGTNLRWGIQTLLAELDPALKPVAAEISTQVLHHPLVSDSSLSGFQTKLTARWKLASAVRQTELIDILHRLAAPEDDAAAAPAEPWRAALKTAFDRFDRAAAEQIADAARRVRTDTAAAAAAAPPVAAMLTQAESLTRGIGDWFDSMMDRVSQRFSFHARIWTVIFSFAVAFALHVDSLTILRELESSPDVRARLIADADTLSKKADALSATGAPAQDDTAAVRNAASSIQGLVDSHFKMHVTPDPFPSPFYAYWKFGKQHLLGVFVTSVLLSMGAPFWFNILKTLMSLRPALAEAVDKDEKPTAPAVR